MVNIFKKYRFKIRNHLVQSEDIRNEFKKIILTTQITLTAIVACFVFAILDFIQHFYLSSAIIISVTFVFSFSLFLLTRGKFNIAKTIIIFYSCFALAFNASKDGRNAGNEFLWFPIIAGVFLFFSTKEKKYIYLCFCITAFTMLWLEYTNYSFNLHQIPSNEYKFTNYAICLGVSILLVSLFMYYLIKLNKDSEIKLARLNQTLLNRNENLKKINGELDSFVYKASHDLRAPLTSLLGLISLSKKEEKITVIKEYIDLQEKSILKLDSYILDILNMSKNARIEITLAEINFNTLINHIFSQLNFLENNALIKKEVIVNNEVPYIGDEARINIILNNLISNSLRYIDPSKPNPTITLTIETSKESVCIKIKDNGIGIKKDYLGNVFEMFYRATQKTNGSGLGLYIVKETVKKLNGSVKIISEVNEFTEVTVELPNH